MKNEPTPYLLRNHDGLQVHGCIRILVGGGGLVPLLRGAANELPVQGGSKVRNGGGHSDYYKARSGRNRSGKDSSRTAPSSTLHPSTLRPPLPPPHTVCSPIPNHDGTDCFRWDKTLWSQQAHFKYRWELFKSIRAAIDKNVGGLQ